MIPRLLSLIPVFLVLSGLSLAQAEIRFDEKWCFEAPEPLIAVHATEGKVFFSTVEHYGALDIEKGTIIWMKCVSHLFRSNAVKRALHDGIPEVFIASDSGTVFFSFDNFRIEAFDMSSGKMLWNLPLHCKKSAIGASKGRLFCMPKPAELLSVDGRTGKTIWKLKTAKVSRKTSSSFYELKIPPVAEGNRLIIINPDDAVLSIMPSTGKVLWRKNGIQVASIASDEKNVYLRHDFDKITALDWETGRKQWTYYSNQVLEAIVSRGKEVYTTDGEGDFFCIDATQGTQLWKKYVAGFFDLRPCPDGIMVERRDDLVVYSPEGETLWRFPYPAGYRWSDVKALEDGLLISAGELISVFKRNVSSQCPIEGTSDTEPISYSPHLSAKERHIILSRGDDAFPVILESVKRLDKLYREMKNRAGASPEEVQAHRSDIQDALSLLVECAGKGRTVEIVRLAESVGDDDEDRMLFRWLAEKGSSVTDSFFLDRLPPGLPGNRRSYLPVLRSLRDYSMELSQDDCMKALQERFHIPWMNPFPDIAQFEFFIERGGSSPSLEMYIHPGERRRIVPSIEDALCLEEAWQSGWAEGRLSHHIGSFMSEFIDMGTDPQGRKWGLFQSPLRGIYGDVWIAERRAGKWREPRCLCFDYFDVDNTDWISRFTKKGEFSKDSDWDGLPDCIERTFGTDPFNPDSDGDGLEDSVDRNPLAAPRRLSDEEEIVKAAMEWRAHNTPFRVTPWVVKLPQGMKPFEIDGCIWVTLMTSEDKPLPLFKREAGADMVWLRPPEHLGKDRAALKPVEGELILFNDDRTEAWFSVNMDNGGLSGIGVDLHLIKVRGYWEIIKCLTNWVS
ncbi:MAG: PQQ-binding-like beta-propeller repeat protein [Vulcanimicrobiota bacterium]